MKTVYLVRHGESEANVDAPLFLGDESVLTEKGKQQARFIAERAAALSFDALIASPVHRAQETAHFIAERTGHVFETCSLMAERVMPRELVGKRRDDPKAEATYEAWVGTLFDPDKRVGEGENFDDLKRRAGEALRFLETRPERSLLIVTHGLFLRTILARVIFGDGLRPDELRHFIKATRTTNTGITILAHGAMRAFSGDSPESRWYIRVYNDHAHLGEVAHHAPLRHQAEGV